MKYIKWKKKSKIHLLLLSFLLGNFSLLQGADIQFTLKNPLGFDRTNELVEVRIPEVTDFSSLALYDKTAQAVAYQVLGDGKIRFQATVKAGSTATYTLRNGIPGTVEKKTYAAQKIPATRNDIAWENDLSAFRMYSSKLLSTESNTANGVDMWCKKKAYPVVDKMYTYSNYHNEQEEGVDAYSVNGKTLGLGGVVAYVSNRLWKHKPYDACTIVENGPLRSEFVLTYNNVEIDGDYYTKTLRITTTANGLLNKAIVRFEGKKKPMQVAVGIYLHTDMGHTVNGVQYTSDSNVIGYAENKSEGSVTSSGARLYAGVYMPGTVAVSTIEHHLVIKSDYTVGTDFTYYFGGGWNIFPREKYISDGDWFDALTQFKQCITYPLTETSMDVLPKKDEVIGLIHKANQYWQSTNPTHGNSFWNRAAYHTGNMEAYAVTQEKAYLDFSKAWSERNEWKGAKSDNKSKWKYTYGETDEHVLFGDYQICFQVYADLYNLEPDDRKIARAREVMEYQMSTDFNGYWWWADGLYMVMPVMTKLYKITQNPLYLEKLYEYWSYANELMYDAEAGLYYRDAKYVYPQHQTPNGKKDFWARGDGWVFAALAKVLQDLPETDAHREEYIDRFRTMAKAIAAVQQEEGYWSRSLLDPDYASGYETSGTAFFTYGFLWGINNGYLSEKEYGKTVEKAWNYLSTIALQENGKVGYVQPIGESAGQHTVSAETTADFGVGAFLLAASEMSRFSVGDMPKPVIRLYSVGIENGTHVTAVFSKVLDAASAQNPGNYTINGKVVDGQIRFDGNHTVTIVLNEALGYGRYTFAVKELTGEEGEDIEKDCNKPFVYTVPLTPGGSSIVVTAIGNQTGNTPQNTVDGKLETRWSQEGKNQWIKYDLGTEEEVCAVDLAFYSGNARTSYFDVELSTDDVTFTKVLSNLESSGLTNEMERYAFTPQRARYVRVVCNGNSASNWNSITEARICYSNSTVFDGISLPSCIYTDFLLPAGVTWASSDESLVSPKGFVNLPQIPTRVVLTATSGTQTKDFEVRVMPRNLDENKLIHYDFEESDQYTKDEISYLKDKGRKGNDARIYGNARISGVLDLIDNTDAGFSTNGYLMLPEGLTDSLRSYSVLVKVNPSVLEKSSRIYDFGSSSGNSTFARLDIPGVGFKYNGGATTLINSSRKIESGKDTYLAFIFDAKTKVTKIYMDGEITAEATSIAYEPCQLSQVASNIRNYIGRTQWWDTNYASDNVDFQGTMDDFYVYNIALTEQEIKTIQLKEGNAIERITQDTRFTIYPNPVHRGEKVSIDNSDVPEGNYRIEMINAQGACVYDTWVRSFPVSIATINQPGLYLIRITDEASSSHTYKLIVE